MLDNHEFTKREAQVVGLLMEGKSNKQIAGILGISEGTVEFHLTRIYAKLGVGSRLEALIRLPQLGPSPHTLRPVGFGETVAEKQAKLGQPPDEFVTRNAYDEAERTLPPDTNEMTRMRISLPGKYGLRVLLGLALVLIAAVALYMYLSRPRMWRGYERESEYPEVSTVGQTIGRSNASGDMAHGQFGSIDVEPWSAAAGDVVYKNISMPSVQELYLKLRYSKNSPPSVPILIYVDDEQVPRASIYLKDQKDWNRFAWTEPIFLGSVESGVHAIQFSTSGQQYGVADLDKFVLSAGSP